MPIEPFDFARQLIPSSPIFLSRKKLRPRVPAPCTEFGAPRAPRHIASLVPCSLAAQLARRLTPASLPAATSNDRPHARVAVILVGSRTIPESLPTRSNCRRRCSGKRCCSSTHPRRGPLLGVAGHNILVVPRHRCSSPELPVPENSLVGCSKICLPSRWLAHSFMQIRSPVAAILSRPRWLSRRFQHIGSLVPANHSPVAANLVASCGSPIVHSLVVPSNSTPRFQQIYAPIAANLLAGCSSSAHWSSPASVSSLSSARQVPLCSTTTSGACLLPTKWGI